MFIYSRRKLLKILGAILLLLIVSALVKSYWFKGRLVVHSSSPTAILSIWTGKSKAPKTIGKGNASVRLSGGEYFLQAEDGDNSTRVSFQIHNRHTTTFNLSLQPVSKPQIVVPNMAGFSLKQSPDGGLTFVNSHFRTLLQSTPGAQAPTTYLGDLYPLNQVDWTSGGAIVSYGSGEMALLDTSGGVQALGSNLPLNNPPYAVAANGNVAYIANRKLVFKPSATSPLSRVLADVGGDDVSLTISANGSKILVYSGLEKVDSQTKVDNTPKNMVVDVNNPSTNLGLKTAAAITAARWDAGGKILAYTTGSAIRLYDTDTQKTVDLPQGDLSEVSWLLGFDSKGSLIYSQDGALWKTDSAKPTVAYKLANYEGSVTPQSFLLNTDQSSFFFSTDPTPSGQGGNIYKLNL
jgi:hypothetical protein